MDFIIGVEDRSRCLTCDTYVVNNRFLVVDQCGGNAGMHSLCQEFLNASIVNGPETARLYFCRRCRNAVVKWKKYKDLVTSLEKTLRGGLQRIIYHKDPSSSFQEKTDPNDAPSAPQAEPTILQKETAINRPEDKRLDEINERDEGQTLLTPQKTASQQLSSENVPPSQTTAASTVGFPHRPTPEGSAKTTATNLNQGETPVSCACDSMVQETVTAPEDEEIEDVVVTVVGDHVVPGFLPPPDGLQQRDSNLIGARVQQRNYHTNRASRNKTHTYRSVSDVAQFEPIVKSLVNGSVSKTITSLYSCPDLLSKVCRGVARCVRKEVASVIHEPLLRSTACEDLLTYRMEDAADRIRVHCPLLWAVLAAASDSEDCTAKLVTAVSILLNERNQSVNTFQTLNSVTMYHSGLQKDGHLVLNDMGIGVSHQTLMRVLHKANDTQSKTAEMWKRRAEEYHRASTYSLSLRWLDEAVSVVSVGSVDPLMAALERMSEESECLGL